MEEIKEILGHDHIIFKITDKIDDSDDKLDILERIGEIVDNIKPDDSSAHHISSSQFAAHSYDYSKVPVASIEILEEIHQETIRDLDRTKIAALHKPVEIKNPFKYTPKEVQNIGWTDWIRSFIMYDKKEDYELSYEELKYATKNRSALPRLHPEIAVEKHKQKQIIFGGCAGMYHYFLGIAAVLQEKFDLSDVVFGCVSGGSFPALTLILDLPVRKMHETWNKEILKDLNESMLKAFSRLNGIVFEKSKKYLPADAHLRAKDRLFVSLTEFPSLKNHIVHNWQTLDALLDCIQASCFIPIFDTRFWTIFDQTRYVDGGLSNNKPIPYPDSPYFYITTNIWREIPLHWYWCYTSASWSDQLFNWGIEDATKHLDAFSFLTPKVPKN